MKKLLFFVVALVLAGNLAAANFQTKASVLTKKAPVVKTEKKDREPIQDLNADFEWEEMNPAWTVIDEDADGQPWMLSTIAPHEGAKHMRVAWNSSGNNDWLITPKLTIAAAAELKFWAKSNGSYLESYNVMISEASTAIADFTTTLATVVDAPNEYTENIYDLAAYDGKEIYIAIQCISVDAYYLDVDDFSVSNCTWEAFVDEAAPEFVSLKGNTVLIGADMNLTLTVSDATGVPETIEATYDIIDSEETLTMTLVADKGDFAYVGTIESPEVAADGDIIFHLADTVEPDANTTDVVKHITFRDPVIVDAIDEDFEAFTDFAVDPLPWTFIDNDGTAAYDFDGLTFENSGYTGSFIVFNPSATTPPLAEDEFAPHSGDKYMACIVATTPDNDDWMISPQVTMSEGYKLEFWAKSVTDDFGLERFKVGLSTTSAAQADFTIISDDLNAAGKDYIEAPIEWTKYSFDLSAYSAEDHIYFAINCVSSDAFMLMVDDVKIGVPSDDLTAPEFVSLTGTEALEDVPMDLTLTLSDDTGVVTPLTATYNVGGEDLTIEMVQAKGEFVFTGQIPAQVEGTVGTISFNVVDTSPAANSTVLGPYDIAWINGDVEEGWFGAVDAQNTSGLGLQNSAPWKLGMILDFGAEEFYINKIAYMCNDGTVGPLNWGVLDVTEEGAWTADVLIDDQLLTNEPVIGTEWVEVNTTDNTVLTGKIGLTVDLTGGGYWARDEVSTVGISYIYYNDTWMLLGEGDLASFPGDWVLKAWAGPTEGIEEEIVAGSTELYQNYPNPFNPSTTINFFNNMSGDVKLSVFNVKGELVSTLVDGHMSASQHSVNFNAANLNSGVYYYTLETPTKSITKKMILVK